MLPGLAPFHYPDGVPPPGGPAAIYGFLFQVLRTAEWALTIDLQAREHDETDVTIVAEPPGGDVDIRFPRSRLVQQFKVRDGAWSLTDVVEKTFPDLYRAITDERENIRYEFVTNGWMGEWAAAYEFFRSLASRNPGARPLDALDSGDERFVFREHRYSERSLFEKITNVLRKHNPAKKEEETTTHLKLWHLLSRFSFETTGDFKEAEDSVRRLVSAYVPDDGSLADKVPRLRDTLFGYASSGNRSFTPGELLHDAGIEGLAFTKLPLARASMREVTLADMHHLVGYDRALSGACGARLA